MTLEVDGITVNFSRPDYRRSAGLVKFGSLWQSKDMKKQASDQQFHERKYQERKRAEAAKKTVPKRANETKAGNSATGKQQPENEEQP
jgi:hypothetical protein